MVDFIAQKMRNYAVINKGTFWRNHAVTGKGA